MTEGLARTRNGKNCKITYHNHIIVIKGRRYCSGTLKLDSQMKMDAEVTCLLNIHMYS